jgi:hypothetical protein
VPDKKHRHAPLDSVVIEPAEMLGVRLNFKETEKERVLLASIEEHFI